MSFHSLLNNPPLLRTALFCLSGVLVLIALLIRRIREKRNPEPRVIRLSLDPERQPSLVRTDTGSQEVAEPEGQARFEAVAPGLEIAGTQQLQPAVAISPPAQAPEPPPPIVPLAPPSEEPPPPVASEEPLTSPIGIPAGEMTPQQEAAAQPATAHPAIASILALQQRSPMLLDVLRGALIMIAVAVAAALVLVVIPQGAADRLALALRPSKAPGPPPEKIAFLFLGDEVKDNQFHIRGVVRNITSQPIEQLDATIRLYALDRTLLETTVVRMDTDIIFPDATASFHLSFPDYRGQFGSYSLDFKLRQGESVPYKDVREARVNP